MPKKNLKGLESGRSYLGVVGGVIFLGSGVLAFLVLTISLMADSVDEQSGRIVGAGLQANQIQTIAVLTGTGLVGFCLTLPSLIRWLRERGDV